jgi:hypothetical protein
MIKHPVKCPKCKGTGQIPRKDLPPLLKGAIGVRQTEECPVCDGTGYVEGQGGEEPLGYYPNRQDSAPAVGKIGLFVASVMLAFVTVVGLALGFLG